IPNAKLCDRTGLHAPNVPRIFPDRTVARELAGTRNVENDLLRPFVRLAVEVAEPSVGLKIGGQIGQMHERVAVGQEGATQRLEDPGLIRAEVVGEDQIERLPGFRLIFIMPIGAVPRAAVGDFLGSKAEQEEVLLPRLLGHFDRGAVARPDGQRTVHHELHVAGAARLVARGRDLVRDVGGRNATLRQRDIVFRQEHNLELAAHRRISVYRLSQVVDELDDDFREIVGWRRLAGEEERARRDIETRILTQTLIDNNDPQSIEQLALIFVDALDLAIEDGVRIDGDV